MKRKEGKNAGKVSWNGEKGAPGVEVGEIVSNGVNPSGNKWVSEEEEEATIVTAAWKS